jgi:hypothetical protein
MSDFVFCHELTKTSIIPLAEEVCRVPEDGGDKIRLGYDLAAKYLSNTWASTAGHRLHGDNVVMQKTELNSCQRKIAQVVS